MLKIKNCVFIDAQQTAKDHPKTFEVPTLEELDHIKSGSIVKVCAYNERFWAVVKTVKGEVITATVDNDLATPNLKYKDRIKFLKRNIYNVCRE
jgi:hypothetical protein